MAVAVAIHRQQLVKIQQLREFSDQKLLDHHVCLAWHGEGILQNCLQFHELAVEFHEVQIRLVLGEFVGYLSLLVDRDTPQPRVTRFLELFLLELHRLLYLQIYLSNG